MSEEKKTITLAELNGHKTHEDLWLLIEGKDIVQTIGFIGGLTSCLLTSPVYNVSKFMDEHPGGDEVLLSEGGKDATEAFEDVGHSDDARALLKDMLVGEIEGGAAAAATKPKANTTTSTTQQGSHPAFMLVPLVLLGAFFAYKNFA